LKDLRILSDEILSSYARKPLIAVVGNAGVQEEDQQVIDTADIVVRFNNYGTREGITKTSDPLKCDILFSTLDLHSTGAKPKDIIIGIPYPFKAREISSKIPRWYDKSRKWMVNPYLNLQCCLDIGLDSEGFKHPLPSIGTTALWHMKDWKAQFYIAGMNWYYSEGRFQKWDLKNTDYPACWNHNYCKELKWILANLFQKNNIMFSPSCTKILKIAQQLSGWPSYKS